MTSFSPREIVSGTRPFHHRPERRQARRRHRAAQPLAPPAARRAAARRGFAEEHPDDRADRLRQDRDRAPPRQARRRALRQGRGDQVHRGRLCRPRRRIRSSATWSRSRSGWCARSRAQGRQGQGPCRAEERVLDALVGKGKPRHTRFSFRRASATASSTTRRSRSRSPRHRLGARRCSRCPACRAPRSARSTSATCSERPLARGASAQAARAWSRRPTARWSEESRQAARPGRAIVQPALRDASRTTASSSSTRSTRSRPRGCGSGADVSRGRAARPAAADRGHHGRDQAWAGEDRPHPVHRLGRLPRLKPSDLLPELQGRLPIRVELQALTEDDFVGSQLRCRGPSGPDPGRRRRLCGQATRRDRTQYGPVALRAVRGTEDIPLRSG
jgi:hypothetical protein